MGFSHCILQAISQIYSLQQTRLLLNGELTTFISICKGMRHGYPLSPLLFILSLEGFLNQIRQHPMIKGLKIKGFQYKCQAFVDDLIILEDFQYSIAPLCSTLNAYGLVSGFKANKQKMYVSNP